MTHNPPPAHRPPSKKKEKKKEPAATKDRLLEKGTLLVGEAAPSHDETKPASCLISVKWPRVYSQITDAQTLTETRDEKAKKAPQLLQEVQSR